VNQTESKKATNLRQVFTVVERNGKNFWVRIGTAFINKDGSESVYLDALPVNGRMQIRNVENRNGPEAEAEK
jgi:hypothetical protein